MVLLTNFAARCLLVFALTQENAFLGGVILKDRRFLQKAILGTNSPPSSLELLKIYNVLNFWKTKTFFEKLDFRFLVESITIKSATFPYKTNLSKTNLMTNEMGNTKWTYHKESSFVTNYLIFLKFNFSTRHYLINGHIHTFFTRFSFIWRWKCVFNVSILKVWWDPAILKNIYFIKFSLRIVY